MIPWFIGKQLYHKTTDTLIINGERILVNAGSINAQSNKTIGKAFSKVTQKEGG
jgi:hypothetical protein